MVLTGRLAVASSCAARRFTSAVVRPLSLAIMTWPLFLQTSVRMQCLSKVPIMVSPAKARAVLGARGSLFDHAFASESASAVLAAVALPLFLLSAAQELEQDAA